MTKKPLEKPFTPPREMVYEDSAGNQTPCLVLGEREGYRVHEYRVRFERVGRSPVEHWVPVDQLFWPTK